MSTEIRQRRTSPQDTVDHFDMGLTSYDESRLSASALMAASPVHSGMAMKMHVPAIYTFLPQSLQWFISRCCPKSFSPQWKRRYLIALGSYIYRFKDENGTKPKGAPIPAETVTARIINREEEDDGFNFLIDCLPPGYDTVFEVTSVGKTQYFAVESREEAVTWINSLHQLVQDAITRNMGHAKDIPYPKEWASFDRSANRLREQKSRIKSAMEKIDQKEQEMRTFGMGTYS